MLGGMLVAIISILVAITIYSGSIVPTIGETTTTAAIVNQSINTKNAAGYNALGGKALISNSITQNGTTFTVLAYNGTGVVNQSGCSPAPLTTTCLLGEGNFTVTNNFVDTDGTLVPRLQVNVNGFNGTSMNVSYTTQPDGYISDSGARSVTLLIVIFAALAIAVIALAPAIKEFAGF